MAGAERRLLGRADCGRCLTAAAARGDAVNATLGADVATVAAAATRPLPVWQRAHWRNKRRSDWLCSECAAAAAQLYVE